MSARYPPIEDHALIGDLKTAALVTTQGSIDFLCFPAFGDPSIFAALLDHVRGGHFQIHPDGEEMRSKQLYITGTNILVTRFSSAQGIGEVTDFMPLDTRGATNLIVRRVQCIQGNMAFRLVCHPAFHYGQHTHQVEPVSEHELRFTEEGEGGLSLRLVATVPLHGEAEQGVAAFTVRAGETVDVVLENGTSTVGPEQVSTLAQQAFEHTWHYWKTWLEQCTYQGDWRELVHRSALALKLMISHEHGSMVAAPTFSLPEKSGGALNWDYRFTWIRDASFSMHALVELGFRQEADDYLRWIERICHRMHRNQDLLSIMYRQDGTTEGLDEQTLSHLEGYRGASPVRIGNQAYQQTQLDVYGELMNAVYLYDLRCEPISYQLWKDIERLLHWLADHWQDKDQGVWEERGAPHSFLYSHVMEWVAFERAVELGNKHSFPVPSRWVEIRDDIFHHIFHDFWDDDQQAFIRAQDDTRMDGSTLLMPMMRMVSGKDEQWLATLRRIEETLVSEPYVYRHLPAAKSPHDENLPEGAFTACSFWYIECLARAGQTNRARLLFDKMTGYANHVGLYSEELGEQGEQLGNFPQALSHLSLISAALYLDRKE